MRALALLSAPFLLSMSVACGDNEPKIDGHGPIAEGISAPLGQPWPSATEEQLASFERGIAVMERRFSRSEGLGPAFNVTFCGACHEKPVFGGAAGHYRNFFIAGREFEGNFFAANAVSGFLCGDPPDGVVVPPEDRILLPKDQYDPPFESREGAIDGVIRMYFYGDDNSARPAPYLRNPETEEPGDFNPPPIDVIAQRNPIPLFGVGLIAELSSEEIIKREDPDDRDGDGISGRAHLLAGRDTDGDGRIDTYDVGRFGVKAQTTSIEGFIRGPLYNHMGITSDPLTEAQRARLPIDSSAQGSNSMAASSLHGGLLAQYAQAVAPTGPNCDIDEFLDPELDPELLFDLVSASMMMAAPLFEEETDQIVRGRDLFDGADCAKCHTPRLQGPRGPIPAYSDLLLHDMGPGLDDGLEFGEAETFEFRTQLLWGIAAVGPYLHDGRATTIEDAILWHGGEGTNSRERYAAYSPEEKTDLLEFLLSLGGRDQATGGLLLPDQVIPPAGEYGGPQRELVGAELQDFSDGRTQFDKEHGPADGLGGPRLNGDSCRACHFEPTIGGAGPRGTNVMRHGITSPTGEFIMPQVGTSILHKSTVLFDSGNFPQSGADIFEHRQSPSLFGVGLIDGIAEPTIAANADPNDSDGDGISGRVSITDGGRIGKFGWKAQVPSLEEFVRDAVAVELGMTLPPQDGLSFGKINDNDSVADPEMNLEQAQSLLFFMSNLGAPLPQNTSDSVEVGRGRAFFASVGCVKCHMPSLQGETAPVPLYSDLLLHELLPMGALGIEDASANMREFRTAPLWGIGSTGPYMHNGAADTLEQAIDAHDGEAAGVRAAYQALDELSQTDLVHFLESL